MTILRTWKIRHAISEKRLQDHCCSPVASQLTSLHPSILPAAHLQAIRGQGQRVL